MLLRFLTALCLLLPLQARANLDVHPMRVHVDAGKATGVRVHSQSALPQYIRATVKRVLHPGTAREQEVDEAAGDAAAVAVMPSRFALAAGGSRLVRVIALDPVEQETALRVYFEAVPPVAEGDADAAPGAASATVGVSLVWGVLVNVLPAQGRAALQVQGGTLRNLGSLRLGVLRVEQCVAGDCQLHSVERSVYPGDQVALPFEPRDDARVNVYYRLSRDGYREHQQSLRPEPADPEAAERVDDVAEAQILSSSKLPQASAGALAGGLALGVGAASALRRDRVAGTAPTLSDMSPQVSANGAQIARNRDDIAALREALGGGFPDSDDLLRFAPDQTVPLRGARLVGMGEGAIDPDSREGINGAQLFATHKRIGSLEHAALYARVGADALSRPAQAAHLGSAFGSDARAQGNGSTALGAYTWAHGTNSVAIGRGAYVQQQAADGFALGARARVSAENGLAIGASTQVWEDGYNSVAIGYGSVATQPMEVSVGGQGMRRRIVHVMPGAAPDDAVTVRQLNRLAGLLGAGEVDATGQLPGRHYTVLGERHDSVAGALTHLDEGLRGTQQALETATTTLNQRMDGMRATTAEAVDSVASPQATPTPRAMPLPDPLDLPVDARAVDAAVNRANAYTDQAVVGLEHRLNQRMERLDRRLNRMAAMGGAQAAMAMNTAGLPTWSRLGAGVGHADGESALAVGYQRVLDRRAATTFSLNGAFSTGGERTLAMGFGVGW